MTELISCAESPQPSPGHAALVAAEATIRHNCDVSAVFVVTPGTPGNPELPKDVLMIVRMADAGPEQTAAGIDLRGWSPVHLPHWARTLLDSTEGVR